MNLSEKLDDLIIGPPALPVTGAEAEAYLRDVENCHLDTYHRTLPVWGMHPNRAWFSTLIAIDSYAVVMSLIMSRLDSVGIWQHIQWYQEGWAIAVRWMYPRLSEGLDVSLVNDADEKTAADLLSHAADYAQLEVMHIAFGKSLYTVSVDPERSLIRFDRSHQPGENAHHHFSDLIVSRQTELNRETPSEALLAINRIIATTEPVLKDGRIHFSSIVPLLDNEILDACQQITPPETVDLRPNDSMGDFSYGQFLAIWRVLDAWSTCASRLYLQLWQKGVSQSDCMPRQVVPEDEFIAAISLVSHVDASMVRKVVGFLTYDYRTNRPDIFLQPLFKIGNLIVWCPVTVWLSRQPRNALKLLCRTKATQNLGATLNGSRERRLLGKVGDYLQTKAGYAFKLNVGLSFGSDTTELDLIAYRPGIPTEVLLVQGKTPIAADDQNEIDAATEDMIFAAKQCADAERILQAMPIAQKQSLFPFVRWELVTDYYRLVVTPDSEPNSKYDPNICPAISLVAMKNRLRRNKLRSPKVLWETCRDRRWQAKHISVVPSYMPVKVGNVTYELPFVLDPVELQKMGVRIGAPE